MVKWARAYENKVRDSQKAIGVWKIKISLYTKFLRRYHKNLKFLFLKKMTSKIQTNK